jgi:polysaccharide biosynthesis protein PslJ
MLLPLSIYLFKRTGKVVWLGCGGLLTLGALATGSRTAMLMMLVVFGTFVWLKRDEMMRMLPLWLVLLVVIQGVMPGTLQSFKYMLNPVYMLEEQSQEMGTGSGRVADLGPSLAEWKGGNPFFGQGFGTRLTSQEGVEGGAQILDNQWLGTLLEIGAVGVVGLFWLFARGVRRMARRARSATGTESWLATCLCASLLAWTLGLFTYDAFAFVQVTFFAFVILGIAALVARDDERQVPTGAVR